MNRVKDHTLLKREGKRLMILSAWECSSSIGLLLQKAAVRHKVPPGSRQKTVFSAFLKYYTEKPFKIISALRKCKSIQV